MIPDDYEGPRPGDKDEFGRVYEERDHFDPFEHFNTGDLPEQDDWTPPPDTELDDRPLHDRIEHEEEQFDLADLIDTIDPSEWEGIEPPNREWLLDGWIPARQMTLLTGPGAAGKSLMTQQLATCVAMGKPFLGTCVTGARAMYITCEDDLDELHRRQKSICAALGISLPYLHERLYLASLMGALGSELATFDVEGRMRTTESWKRLLTTVKARKIGFVVLDNVAHLFTGNENIRNQVAAFCGLLNRLASETGCAVLLIGHPNKAGDDYSGSTAWNNQVRSRLFLKIPHEPDQEPEDWDARELTNGKANYSANGKQITFRWHNMAFVQESELPKDEFDRQVATQSERYDERVFLTLIDERNSQNRPVSDKPGVNYAPHVLAGTKAGRKVGKRKLQDAMERLFERGEITIGKAGTYDNRGAKMGIIRASDCTKRPRDDLHKNRTKSPAQDAQSAQGNDAQKRTKNDPLYPKGYNDGGATAGASAPPFETPDMSADTPPHLKRADRDPWADEDPPF